MRSQAINNIGNQILLLALVWAVSGCTTTTERNPLPGEYLETAELPGIPDARMWGDRPPDILEEFLELPMDEDFENRFSAMTRSEHNYLAISGGGARGAYGAGVLVGWSDAGTRPEFTLVTGVSTGALAAPFVFLGPRYDDQLEEIYTAYNTADVMTRRRKSAILWSDAIADSEPLRELISRYITEEMVAEIGAQHMRGRRLFLGTTNMDAGRPVLWNIGEISASGQDNALELVRKVLLASASIPGVFPPVYFTVEANGELFDEMHADGGSTAQVNLYPVGFDWKPVTTKFDIPSPPNIYVLRNAKLEPAYSPVTPKTLSIAMRSINSLIRTQGIGDMYRIYTGARRDNMNYHLTYIPADFQHESLELFDSSYMRALFDYGRKLGRSGEAWQDAPPGVNISTTIN